MKIFFSIALLSITSFTQAELIFESGETRNHILTTFQNNDCDQACSSMQDNLHKYKPTNVSSLRFDDSKFQELHKFYSNINGSEVRTPQFFLNHSIIPSSVFDSVDLRLLNDNHVGNLKLKFDGHELTGEFIEKLDNNIKEKAEVKDLTMFVAVTTPIKSIYMEKGDNEGKFISNEHNVLFIDSVLSSNLSWVLNIPYKKFDESSLSFVVWIEDDNKNIIQSASSPFHRFSY